MDPSYPLATGARPSNLVLGLEDRPPLPQSVALGFQHVLVSNVWLDPVFVAAVGGLSAALAGNMINAIFLAAGIVTLTQSTRLVRLPIVEGPSAAFDGLMIGFAKGGQLAMATTGLLIAGVVILIFAASGLLGQVRRLFSPAVTGAVILLVGIALAGFTLEEFLGGDPKSASFAAGDTLLIASATMLTVVLLSAFGRGMLRSYAFIWGLLVGDGLSLLFGRLSFDAAGQAAWLGIPQLLPYGSLQFDAGITAAMLFAFVVAVIEAIGVYQAAGEILKTPITSRRIQLGVSGEAVGSILSSLFGGFATTAYAQNVGLLKLTGVGSRFPVTVAGVIFLVLGFVPKLGALLAATPDPVVGGIFLPAAASLILTGVITLARTPDTPRHATVAGLAIIMGTGIPPLVGSLVDKLPTIVLQLLSQPVVVGAVVALVVEILLVQIPTLGQSPTGVSVDQYEPSV
ncbi:MAG TPA: solute carrier family 23 protein [Chloroflexota bacterium]|jgi:NCS2 family nucleobase:cation symporter-2|nr:solute carrier family 23 protein [Chloroflexota bacterium]